MLCVRVIHVHNFQRLMSHHTSEVLSRHLKQAYMRHSTSIQMFSDLLAFYCKLFLAYASKIAD